MHGHRLRPTAALLAGLLVAAALTGCGQPAGEEPGPVGSGAGESGEADDTEPEDAAPGDPESDDGEPGTGRGGDATVEGLDDAVTLTVEDAAGEHDVAPDAVEVRRADEVEWPDGARGCPGDGELHTQAVVPGYLIVVEVDGERVRYHAGEGEAPFRCDDPQPPL